MAKLSKTQLAFIAKMNLNIHDLFDASGLRAGEWKLKMKELGKLVAFGVTPCAASGHTLRTREGHCVLCNPAVLAYSRRHSDNGDVYVAWSKKGGIAKIGCAKDANLRILSLIETCYGGQNDWSLELIYECTEAGLIESTTHKLLKDHELKGVTYLRDGRLQECSELFSCTLNKAKSALETTIKEYLN